MKKSGIFVLVLLTVLFTGFVCGFFIGRNWNHGDVQISALKPPISTEPTAAPATKPLDVSSPTDISQTPTQPTTAPATVSNGKVNINTAGLEELMTLPGIGEVLAKRILDYRNTHGAFQSPADLLMVDGIGEKRLDAIMDYITLGG